MVDYDKNTFGADIIPEVILPIVESCNFGSKYFRIINDGNHTDMYGLKEIEVCGSGKEISAMIKKLEGELNIEYYFSYCEELPKISSRGKYYLCMKPHQPFYRVKNKARYDIYNITN